MKKILLLVSLLIAFCNVEADIDKAMLDTDAKKVAYLIGYNYGSSMARDDVEIDHQTFFDAFEEGFKGSTNLFTDEEIREIMLKFQADLKAKAEVKRKALAEKNQKQGEEFLKANKEKEGVKRVNDVSAESGGRHKACCTVFYRRRERSFPSL